tara:strand:+ start:1161 stop:1664 length:504 start_codon:yes stop_codon:yes gene_type:complete
MGVMGDKLRKNIKQELNNNAEKIDHDCDCIVEDIRKGKDQGNNIKKTLKFIEDVSKAIAHIKRIIKTVKSIQETLEATKEVAEAGRKASIISSALNPAAAASAIVQETVIKKAEEEVEDLKDASNIAEPAIEVFSETLSRNKVKITQALADKAMSDAIGSETKNMLD